MSIKGHSIGLPDVEFKGTAHVLRKADLDYIENIVKERVVTVQELMKDRDWPEIYAWQLVRCLHSRGKIGLAGSVVGPA
jgi:hypothetical protein